MQEKFMIKEKHKLYREMNFYEKYIKRAIDIVCSLLVIVLFSWLFLIITLLVRIKLGNPVIFTQYRPGLIDQKTGKEQIFKLYKFRTMTDKKDSSGNLLPDELRLTKFGLWLRSTSLDELPEVFCILKGTMTIIGPRPQLVKDMVFMFDEQRMRHTAKPGLSGLAQVSGRNAISWEKKMQYDLEYIQHITFRHDLKIIFKTFVKAFIMREGITEEGNATAADYGDYLLHSKQISIEDYENKQKEAIELLKGLKL